MKRSRIKDILDDQRRSILWLSKETGMVYHHLHTIVNSNTIPDGTTYATLTKIRKALGLNSIGDLEEDIKVKLQLDHK